MRNNSIAVAALVAVTVPAVSAIDINVTDKSIARFDSLLDSSILIRAYRLDQKCSKHSCPWNDELLHGQCYKYAGNAGRSSCAILLVGGWGNVGSSARLLSLHGGWYIQQRYDRSFTLAGWAELGFHGTAPLQRRRER